MAHLIIENARVYILILCKVLVEVFFFPTILLRLPPPRVYLSLRFKRNRLKILGHLIAVYTCMLGENHKKKSYYGQISIEYKKKAKIHTTQWKARMCFDISKQFQPAFMSF